MLLLASMVLASSTWASAPSCPTAFSSVNTTVGALSNSSQLTICASKAQFVKGSNGSLNLILGTQTNTAPQCLIYPNGLSFDLTNSLLTSGHVGCWSLYPPTQVVSIINIGKPSQVKLQTALKSFRPEVPKIFFRPNSNVDVGTKVLFSSSAKTQVITSKMLNLPAQIRFKPTKYKWSFDLGQNPIVISGLAKPTYVLNVAGRVRALLAVSYSVEYTFTGLSSWTQVKPDIIQNASPVNFSVSGIDKPATSKAPPRLVREPCTLGSLEWRC